jgi:hypothetical protein
MSRRYGLVSFVILLALVFYSFYSLMPQAGKPANAPTDEFSAQRALVMLREIAQKPHYHANDEHARVRDYLVGQLKSLGFEVSLQADPLLELRRWPQKKGDSTRMAAGGYNLITPINILGRQKGSGNGKALLLLSHYDSAKVPSPGASDAGSGIVTILEAVRAYLASGARPVNDLIVLFTDAEELGLDGAKTFVNQHPWASDVGLVLNFEARGSGGPGNMIVETNGGNTGLIDAFAAAQAPYPVASSLMYSVYKMLPNDTDSTIFRKDGDIDSFFFAFIDDHFDYHTASDTVENLDIETLQHQGSYLLPLLHHFSQTDLGKLKSGEDQVYANMPHLFIHYPFSWVIPMVIIAAVLLILLVNYGFFLERLEWGGIGRGMLALLLSLLLSGLVGYFGWQLIEQLYPQYSEVQHGFKYNGHSYIAFFVLLSLASCFFVYRWLQKGTSVVNFVVAPLLLWIVINSLIAVYLKGAGFFVIPVYFGLLAFWVLLRQTRPNMLLLVLVGAPAIFLFAPMIRAFPVGLGSDFVVISAVMTVLLFGLLYNLIGYYRLKKGLAWICLLAGFFYFFKAHSQSDFNANRKKPNSLVYYLDKDNTQAYWATYDRILDNWTRRKLGNDPAAATELMPGATMSKYNRGYTYASKAAIKDLQGVEVVLNRDSIIGDQRVVSFLIIPKRKTDQLYLYSDQNSAYSQLWFNDLAAEKQNNRVLTNEFGKQLLSMNCKAGDSLAVTLHTTVKEPLHFEVITYGFDLMENPLFDLETRPSEMMPKPFVNTDATIVKEHFSIPRPIITLTGQEGTTLNRSADE